MFHKWLKIYITSMTSMKLNRISSVKMFSFLFTSRQNFFRGFSAINPYARNKEEYLKSRHIDVLTELTGSTEQKVKKELSSLQLQDLDENTIISRVNTLKGINLTDKNTLDVISLLTNHPKVLRNRYRVLCECGIKSDVMDSNTIKRFLFLMRKPVAELKKNGLIEKDFNVMMNLWRLAGFDPDSCPNLSEELPCNELRCVVIKKFLKETMQFSEEELAEKEIDIFFRLKYMSIEILNRNLYIFKEMIGLSKVRLRNNWFILHSDPENTMEVLDKLKVIGNIDDSQIYLHLYPKIAMMPARNAENMINYIKEAKIPVEYLQRCLKLLTLNCETVRDRISYLKKNDFFFFNYKHPCILFLLHYQVKVRNRLQILEDLNMEPHSVYSMLSNEKTFQRLCEIGMKYIGSDIIHYLKSELSVERDDLIPKLNAHRRWRYVSIVQVGRNLRHLRKSFTDDEIKKNIHVLFYCSDKVIDKLVMLNSCEGLEMFRVNGVLQKQYILPLTIYFLELETHFTGESVWNSNENPYKDLPDFSKNITTV